MNQPDADYIRRVAVCREDIFSHASGLLHLVDIYGLEVTIDAYLVMASEYSAVEHRDALLEKLVWGIGGFDSGLKQIAEARLAQPLCDPSFRLYNAFPKFLENCPTRTQAACGKLLQLIRAWELYDP